MWQVRLESDITCFSWAQSSIQVQLPGAVVHQYLIFYSSEELQAFTVVDSNVISTTISIPLCTRQSLLEYYKVFSLDFNDKATFVLQETDGMPFHVLSSPDGSIHILFLVRTASKKNASALSVAGWNPSTGSHSAALTMLNFDATSSLTLYPGYFALSDITDPDSLCDTLVIETLGDDLTLLTAKSIGVLGLTSGATNVNHITAWLRKTRCATCCSTYTSLPKVLIHSLDLAQICPVTSKLAPIEAQSLISAATSNWPEVEPSLNLSLDVFQTRVSSDLGAQSRRLTVPKPAVSCAEVADVQAPEVYIAANSHSAVDSESFQFIWNCHPGSSRDRFYYDHLARTVIQELQTFLSATGYSEVHQQLKKHIASLDEVTANAITLVSAKKKAKFARWRAKVHRKLNSYVTEWGLENTASRPLAVGPLAHGD